MSKEIIIKTERTTNYVYLNNEESSVPTVFLHGFTGSHRSWNEVVDRLGFRAITVDLPGHGFSVFNNLGTEYSIDDWCEDFNKILDDLGVDAVNLCGYSMGGRLAIAFAAKYPHKINRLILESASYGVEDKKKREERFQEDLKLCRLIEKDLAEFVQKWQNNPLFSNQKRRRPQSFLNQQKERLSHDPRQLSKALSSFSQGKMRFYKNSFAEFKFPITVINGADDLKYIEMGKILCRMNRKATQCILDSAGHNTHLENVSKFIVCLK